MSITVIAYKNVENFMHYFIYFITFILFYFENIPTCSEEKSLNTFISNSVFPTGVSTNCALLT